MTFDWDDDKATRNLAKHGVSFDEAVTAFDDPLYIDFFGPEHRKANIGISGLDAQNGDVCLLSHIRSAVLSPV